MAEVNDNFTTFVDCPRNAEVRVIDAKVEEVRTDTLLDSEEFITALDEAQAEVFSGQKTEAWVVIRITK